MAHLTPTQKNNKGGHMQILKIVLQVCVFSALFSPLALGNSQSGQLRIDADGIVYGVFDPNNETNSEPSIQSACTGYCEGGVIPNCLSNRDSWMPPVGGCCDGDYLIRCGNESCHYSVSGCCGVCPAPGADCYNPPEPCCKSLANCS